MSINPQISKLNELGQSVWYDNLSRDVLNSGELQSLISAGVSGLTSNPTIFKNAITDSSLYDQELKDLRSKGLDTEAICEELMVEDVQEELQVFCDQFLILLMGLMDMPASKCLLFLQEIQRPPLRAAKRLWTKLNLPNIMIKIPGTPEGLPAIRAVLEAGINVNVTLLFTTDNYERVAECYISALEARDSRGESVKGIASVASFFVSRVDAICEKTFDAFVKAGAADSSSKESFFGKIGVANSKPAYGSYERLFGSPRFKKLRDKGAFQRPLWASTGTKNPAFSAVMYIEELAGKDTVNTMPPATLKALLQGAQIAPKLHAGYKESLGLIEHIGSLGLSFGSLMHTLQEDGVVLFSDSYKDLLASIEKKRNSLA